MSTAILTNVVSINPASDSVNDQVFGKKLGIFTRMLGCRHRNVSRPFSNGRQGYRSCINCGSRQQFDIRTLETHGAFYAAPAAVKAQNF